MLGCSHLKYADVPDTVQNMGIRVFDGCTSLKRVSIPPCSVRISDGAFKGFTKLKNIEIPEGIARIGDNAFEDCIRLEEIKIPKSVKIIGTDAFKGCQKLKLVEGVDGLNIIKLMDVFAGTPFLDINLQRKGLCRHCGGEFNGFLTKKCKDCGRPKDY